MDSSQRTEPVASARSGPLGPPGPPPGPVQPSVGWSVLHLFTQPAGPVDGEALAAAVRSARHDSYQVVCAAMLGHRSDVGFVVLGPDLWRLRRFQSEVRSAGLVATSSYISVTEVSEYAAGIPDEMRDARLYPSLPPAGKPAFCFYPMSKRRVVGQNWYELDYDTRRQLMVGHGRIGRTFHGRVLQLITGSTGLDDWEWGVTLFAAGPDDLKDCVYQMRFDEASARYAEFGPFYTGVVGELDVVLGHAVTA